jgi:hypothetical protein
MTRLLLLIAAASIAAAQPRGISGDQLWFDDGTGIEFFTQSSGSTSSVSTKGSVLISAISGAHRLVLDKDSKVIFVYDIEAWRSATPGSFFIRIKPVNRALEQEVASDRGALHSFFEKAPNPLPTVAAVREFPAVKSGEAVLLDILRNPTTGEKIFDVICPSEAVHSATPPQGGRDEFAIDQPHLVFNGRSMAIAAGTQLTGPVIRIELPARGVFYVSTEASPQYAFRPAGVVDRDHLSIAMDDDRLELAVRGNILKHSENRRVWVYFEPGQSRKYANVERQVQQLKAGLAGLQAQYSGNHPNVRSTRAALDLMQQKLDSIAITAAIDAAASIDGLPGRH